MQNSYEQKENDVLEEDFACRCIIRDLERKCTYIELGQSSKNTHYDANLNLYHCCF